MQEDLLSWMKSWRIYDGSQNGIQLHSSSGDMNDPAWLYSISLQLHVDMETKL